MRHSHNFVDLEKYVYVAEKVSTTVFPRLVRARELIGFQKKSQKKKVSRIYSNRSRIEKFAQH